MFKKPPYIFYVKNLGNISKEVKRDAIAIWPFILIAKDDSRTADRLRTLIEHEKIHHKQQLVGWLIGFYVKYFYYHWKYGYKNNPYEIEAYAHQNNWKQRKQ